MTDLRRLTEQRDALTRQIEAATQDAVGDFDFTLDWLYDKFTDWVQHEGLPYEDTSRKNIIRLVQALTPENTEGGGG
jgi:hypothetical protein